VRRYLPELESVEGRRCTSRGGLQARRLRQLDYPEPIVDHDDAAAAFLAKRAT
jgi:deoxyribodipyrimidine photolyase